jgi:hypothetical protein
MPSGEIKPFVLSIGPEGSVGIAWIVLPASKAAIYPETDLQPVVLLCGPALSLRMDPEPRPPKGRGERVGADVAARREQFDRTEKARK